MEATNWRVGSNQKSPIHEVWIFRSSPCIQACERSNGNNVEREAGVVEEKDRKRWRMNVESFRIALEPIEKGFGTRRPRWEGCIDDKNSYHSKNCKLNRMN